MPLTWLLQLWRGCLVENLKTLIPHPPTRKASATCDVITNSAKPFSEIFLNLIYNTSFPQATEREQWYEWEPPREQREQRERSSCLGFSSSQRDGLRQSSAGQSAISCYLLPTKPEHQKYQIVLKATKASIFSSSLNSLCLLTRFFPQFLISF